MDARVVFGVVSLLLGAAAIKFPSASGNSTAKPEMSEGLKKAVLERYQNGFTVLEAFFSDGVDRTVYFHRACGQSACGASEGVPDQAAQGGGDEAALKDDIKKIVENLSAKTFPECPVPSLTWVAHGYASDTRGTKKTNQEYSESRAKLVCESVKSQLPNANCSSNGHGVDKSNQGNYRRRAELRLFLSCDTPRQKACVGSVIDKGFAKLASDAGLNNVSDLKCDTIGAVPGKVSSPGG